MQCKQGLLEGFWAFCLSWEKRACSCCLFIFFCPELWSNAWSCGCQIVSSGKSPKDHKMAIIITEKNNIIDQPNQSLYVQETSFGVKLIMEQKMTPRHILVPLPGLICYLIITYNTDRYIKNILNSVFHCLQKFEANPLCMILSEHRTQTTLLFLVFKLLW